MPLAVAALLVHVPHYLAQQTGDARTWLSFGELMTDIMQEVAIHLGILLWVSLTDTPLLLLLLFQATVLGLTN